MAMLLTYLKTTAENAISTKVADCVISVSMNMPILHQLFGTITCTWVYICIGNFIEIQKALKFACIKFGYFSEMPYSF
jgi:hypothetical protein